MHLHIPSLVLGVCAGATLVLFAAFCLVYWLVSSETEAYDGERLTNLNELAKEPASSIVHREIETQAVGQNF